MKTLPADIVFLMAGDIFLYRRNSYGYVNEEPDPTKLSDRFDGILIIEKLQAGPSAVYRYYDLNNLTWSPDKHIMPRISYDFMRDRDLLVSVGDIGPLSVGPDVWENDWNEFLKEVFGVEGRSKGSPK